MFFVEKSLAYHLFSIIHSYKMPIRVENKHRYPLNWRQEIRPAILKRAGNRCEECGVPNYSIGVRDRYGQFWHIDEIHASDAPEQFEGLGKVFRIILTIAHLNHVPEDCRPENLKAWCQRCHLTWDAKHHARTARRTRQRKSGQPEMFPDLIV